MFDAIQRAIYEAPHIVDLGPHGAAIAAGFAVWVFGEMYLTEAGERYLASLPVTYGLEESG